MTEPSDDLRAQIDGQRLVLFRVLTACQTDHLQSMLDSCDRGLAHVDGGGETIPATSASDRHAMKIERDLIAEAVANRLEHENPA